MKIVKLQTGSQQGKIRLDQFVAHQIENMSRTKAQVLINAGMVKVDGLLVKKSNAPLTADQSIQVTIPFREEVVLEPESMDLEILYEDDDILVLNKPPNLVVHPAHGNWTGTLANGLLYHLLEKRGINPAEAFGELETKEGLRPGIIHRLDKDTSGVMVIALNDLAKRHLAEEFQKRLIQKNYLALVQGKLTPLTGTIEGAIGRDHRDRKKMALTQDGKDALTEYQVESYFQGEHRQTYTLVQARPKTGRTHQIRVHLASLHHPILGDHMYNPHQPPQGIHRQFLHARSLSFTHPRRDEELTFTAPLTQDLENFLRTLQKF